MKCPSCKNPLREKGAGGLTLDAGEFSRIHEEVRGAKVTSPLWAVAMAEAAKVVEEKSVAASKPRIPHV
jgi:hypothetical protein